LIYCTIRRTVLSNTYVHVAVLCSSAKPS